MKTTMHETARHVSKVLSNFRTARGSRRDPHPYASKDRRTQRDRAITTYQSEKARFLK